MRGYVDERQMAVRVKGQSWPFELDCRTGTVALLLEGESVSVRRLLWREKRNLARFSYLGEAFLKDQFLRLSLIDPKNLPESPVTREALWTLTHWFGGLQGTGDLPLDQVLLTQVTLELCRFMGWSPAVLEDLPADEVEALWRASGGEERPVEEGTGGTRILVVPDLEPGGPSVAQAVHAADGLEMQSNVSAAAAPGGAVKKAAREGLASAVSPLNSGKIRILQAVSPLQSVMPSTAARAAQRGTPSQAPLLTPTQILSQSPAKDSFSEGIRSRYGRLEKTGQIVSRSQDRFRVVMGVVAGDPATEHPGKKAVHHVVQRSECTSSEAPNPSTRDLPVQTVGKNSAGAVVQIRKQHGAVSAVALPEAVFFSEETDLAAPQQSLSLVSAPWEHQALREATAGGIRPMVNEGSELENVFEELAERLEAAAGAMGIELEP